LTTLNGTGARELRRPAVSMLVAFFLLIGAFGVTPGHGLDAEGRETSPRLQADSHTRLIELRKGLDDPPDRVVFPYRNAGKAALEVRIKTVSCGCSKVSVKKAVLDPDEEGAVEVELDKKSFRKDRHIYVLVETNDPGQRRTYFELEVRWVPQISVTPGQTLSLGRALRGQEPSVSVQVTQNFGNVPLEVDIVSATDTCLEIVVSRTTVAARQTFSCEIRLAKGAPPGPFEETVLLHTNQEQYCEIPLFVSGIVIGDLVVSPWQVVLGRVPSMGVRKRCIRLLPKPGNACNFVRAYSSLSGLSLDWDRTSGCPSIWATFKAGEETGPIADRIALVSASGEETFIPVVGVVVPTMAVRP